MFWLLLEGVIIVALLKVYLDERSNIPEGVLMAFLAGVPGMIVSFAIRSPLGEDGTVFDTIFSLIARTLVSMVILALLISYWKNAELSKSLFISAVFFAIMFGCQLLYVLLISGLSVVAV